MKLVVEDWFVPMLEWVWDNKKKLIANQETGCCSDLIPSEFNKKLNDIQEDWINELLISYLKITRKFETFVEMVVDGFQTPIKVIR